MKKRVFALAAVCALMGISGCGGKVETQEVDYDMVFENETGKDVSKLEIRYAEDADWSEITLTENEWKNGYEMPVSMAGQMPVAENGWQVQMTFAEDDMTSIWEGVSFANDVTYTFTLENGDAEVMISTEEEEASAEMEDLLTEEATEDDLTASEEETDFEE